MCGYTDVGERSLSKWERGKLPDIWPYSIQNSETTKSRSSTHHPVCLGSTGSRIGDTSVWDWRTGRRYFGLGNYFAVLYTSRSWNYQSRASFVSAVFSRQRMCKRSLQYVDWALPKHWVKENHDGEKQEARCWLVFWKLTWAWNWTLPTTVPLLTNEFFTWVIDRWSITGQWLVYNSGSNFVCK